MEVKLDEKTRIAIEAVLKRGNDVVIRKKGDGIIILEEKRKIVYDPSSNRGRGGAIGADV